MPEGPRQRFLGLHWKAFLWLSGLLLFLSAAFYALSQYHLTEQFRAQRAAEVASYRKQIGGLFRGTSDRLVRLAGAIPSMGDLGDAIKSGNRERLAAVTAAARYSSLGYELEVQRIELFLAGEKGEERVWRWTQTEAEDLPESRLRRALAEVRREEAPVTLLACQPLCLLNAFVPVLAGAENVGVLAVGQSIADLVIEFRALTGADLAIVVPAGGNGGTHLPAWGAVVPALTESSRIRPLLEDLSGDVPDPAALNDGRLVEWRGASYEVHRVPLAEFIPAETGFVVLIADVSARLAAIRAAARQGFVATAGALGVAELILLYLVTLPVRRLRRLAKTLPFLAEGAYDRARADLSASKHASHFRDEVDVLYETAATLSDQLEENARAISAKSQELAVERDFVRGLLDSAQVLVVTQTRYGVIQAANELAAQLTGFSPSELKGRRFVDLIGDVEAHREVLAGLEALTQTGGRRLEQEYPLSRRDGESRQIVWVHTPLREEHSDGTAVLSVGLDVTDRVEAESRMRWLANNDGLTGLVNRHRFLEELKRTYDHAARGGMVSAVLLFDLDHFKEINDTSGHPAGDALLRLVAEDLRARARKSDTVARLGGDEFAMLMPNTDAYGAAAVARQINERLAQVPFVYGERRYRTGASIGIALLPQHGSDSEELLAHADLAMYEAKRAGRSCFRMFAHEHEDTGALEGGVHWKDLLSRALVEGHLFFEYEPVIEVANGAVAFHEALLRFRLEDGRIVYPGEFLPAAQRAGLGYDIDCYAARLAVEILGSGAAQSLSVNLSTAALADERWAEPVKTAVVGGLNPLRLIFEITETDMIADMSQARRIMDELVMLGVRFALDDFGSGFSSLYYLKQLPASFVKIDQSLVKGLAADPRDRDFVRAITTMIRCYGRTVIAEGVEDAATLKLLEEMGVALAQGRYPGQVTETRGSRDEGSPLPASKRRGLAR
jgi:diguanylate cyclase (GGDEF)-like protein/PAS domain S-box-containing protein